MKIESFKKIECGTVGYDESSKGTELHIGKLSSWQGRYWTDLKTAKQIYNDLGNVLKELGEYESPTE